jgi:hypothetical protein
VRTQQGGCQLHTKQEAPAVEQDADKMKKIICICICICICSSFGCGRLQSGGNAENFDDISGVVKHHTPLSSDPANLPATTTSPTPAPTVHANPDLNPEEELCGSEKNVYLYFWHSVLSCFVNSILVLFTPKFPSLKILRMVSAFSFPVHVYLTNPSFLSKSKVSLFLLAGDTCLSLCRLNRGVVLAQIIFEAVRFVAYPHIANFLL